MIVKLPVAVDLSGIAVDPSNTCGDPGSASTQDYRVETTTVTTTPTATDPSWEVANSGSFTADNRGQLNPLTVAAGTGEAVTYVKFTMLRPQVPGDFATTCTAGGFAGCEFMDMTELAVYGEPAA